MRILVISRELPPVGGGAGYVAGRLADQLRDIGHEIDLVTMGFGDLPALETPDPDFHIHRLPCRRRRQDSADFTSMSVFVLRAIRTAKRLAEERPFHLVHAHGIVPDGIAAWRTSRTLGIPFVITAHGSDVPGYNEQQFRWAHVVADPLWKRVALDADLLVTPSDHLAGLIAKRVRRRSQTIPNGIGPDLFPEDVLAAKRPAFLIVARLVPRKNFHLFLEALHRVEERQEVHIVGEGPELDRLRSLARSLRRHTIEFHGWLEHGSPPWQHLYEECRFFVSPSGSENFPVNLLEAQLAGMTVLSSAIPGAREVLGDHAVFFPEISAEAITATVSSVLEQPTDALDALGDRARRRVRDRFSWKRVAQEYDRALAPLVTRSHHDRADHG